MVINNEGIPLKSTLDSSTTVQYGGMVSDLAHHARSIGSRLGDNHKIRYISILYPFNLHDSWCIVSKSVPKSDLPSA